MSIALHAYIFCSDLFLYEIFHEAIADNIELHYKPRLPAFTVGSAVARRVMPHGDNLSQLKNRTDGANHLELSSYTKQYKTAACVRRTFFGLANSVLLFLRGKPTFKEWIGKVVGTCMPLQTIV